MTPALDLQIDALYKLPLEQFTTARNASAKSVSGADRKRIKTLSKPSLAAWTVNQLYWTDRPTYSALIDAAEQLRRAHRAVVSGRHVDVRKPEALHQAAMARAVASTGKILANQAHTSSATVDAVRRILFALPTEVPPGRLAREPEAAGFDLLMGVSPRVAKGLPPGPSSSPAPHATLRPQKDQRVAQAEHALRRTRAAVAAQAKKAKRTEKALESVARTEAIHHAALDKLLRSRKSLEAERAQHENETRRLANQVTTAEQALATLRRR